MGGAPGGRAARALRLLLLLVLALAAVEYLFGTILDASPLRTYIYTPIYNATQINTSSTKHNTKQNLISQLFASLPKHNS
ncbi:unnamed protein product [Leptidea sinapis]|uniref:Uncharacterized protein n=1 Tax=Leptidea sinapis TaxID=189913 RepID=A0A5E4PTW5_9NEOP|nr:unnamed protein product [Leptidea sinapis]